MFLEGNEKDRKGESKMVEEKQDVTMEDLVANLLVEHGALLSLLLEKGIITEEDFNKKADEVAEEMSKE